MQRQSPPKHRHDGTSPLPLGMDWSPPPKNWAGRETVWPHDPHTGWSYCVTIPSRVVLAKSTNSDPIVFYRVLVGLQSPEGNTTTRVVLRRFNDFLKFLAAEDFNNHRVLNSVVDSVSQLKRMFPRKNIPPAPPKGFLRMKTRTLLEERRSSLEEWMTKLLSDIDVSRSVPVASFLELEAAARSSFLDENQHASESNPSVNSSVSSLQVHPNLSLSAIAGSSSLTSDYGSDTAYEISDVGTPRLGRDNNSDFGTDDLSLDEDATSPIDKFVKFGMSNIDEGLFMGQAILEQLGNYPRHRVHSRESNKFEDNNKANGNASKSSDLVVGTDGMNRLSLERENTKVIRHARKLSGESIGSDTSSQRGSELSGSAIPSLYGQGLVDVPRAAETSANIENTDLLLPSDVQLLLLSDQRQKMNRVLATMQRRLITAKTDMEDLISRLNQEIAVKDYLTTKRLYEEERKANEQARTSFMKLLNECQVLRQRFEECNINLVNENEDDLAMDPSCSDALNLLTTYDNQINLILSEVNTDQGADSSSATAEKVNDVNTDSWTVDEKLRNMLTNVLVDNGKLRKQVNSVMRYALKKKMSSPGESEDPSSETIQNKHLDS
ncbi:PX domain-containing protein EREL1 isoform X4 [Lycium barbarum]|uniref:PX domain-containing protein EREL1 isoform X4 n=1 Tax=Lycium barbarum TaxID=112863 RepID=UPI00293F54A4|nr:PX domain-containing protein EREL1 isoform X4 [Lycium barbarum]